MTTKTTKLTQMEKRAKIFAQEVIDYGSGHIGVHWKRNPTWGLNPSVEGNGSKIGYASGCGYCKESAALADALRFLGKDDEEQKAIWRTSGCGVDAVQRALADCGFELQSRYRGKREDSYRIIRK